MSQTSQELTTTTAEPLAVAPAVTAAFTINPEALIMKAIESGLPVESLERLLVMRLELKKEAALAAFAEALARFQADIPPINKSKTARAGSYVYRYADIADIQRAIAPRMAECGLSVTFGTAQIDPNTMAVTAIVCHAAGHCQTTTFPIPIDRASRMNDAQKMGSALTYGRRYALTAALGIVTAEDDDDAQSMSQPRQPERQQQRQPVSQPDPAPDLTGEIISPSQHRLIEARIGELGVDRERVKAWVNKVTHGSVNHLNELPLALLQPLLDRLAASEKQAAA